MNGVIRTAALLLGSAVTAGIGCPTLSAQCTTQACGGGCASACTTHGNWAPIFGKLAGGHHSPTVLEMTGHNNKEVYDRCWPFRYSNLAHRAVNRAFTPQVQNGHVLDQT